MKRSMVIVLVSIGLFLLGACGGSNGGNTAPIANDDSYVVMQDDALSVSSPGVLGNDTDADSDPLTFSLDGDVANGTLSPSTDGSFTYTPDPGYSGTDSFIYRANDGTDESNAATVTITITTTPILTPAAPTNLQVDSTTLDSVTLSWDDNAVNETGFFVERGASSGGPFTTVATLGLDEVTYTEDELSTGMDYYYRVCSFNAGGNSSYSGVVLATTLGVAAPTGLQVDTTTLDSVTLSWTDNATDETGFYVERSALSAGPFTTVATLGQDVETYTQSSLGSGTYYYYRLCSYNTDGDSSYSDFVLATTQSGPGGGPPIPAVDDSLNEAEMYAYDSSGYWTTYLNYVNGPDNIWGTPDDELYWYVANPTRNPDGTIDIVEYYGDPGSDGDWFTGDDLITSYSTHAYNSTGQRTARYRFNDPGSDATWGTGDDLMYRYEYYYYDSSGRRTGYIRYSGAGGDGTWITSDDLVNRIYKYSRDPDGKIDYRIQSRDPGIDGTWFTMDDVVHNYKTYEYDSLGMISSGSVYDDGVDGDWFTGDDVQIGSSISIHDSNGNNLGDYYYWGPGYDGVWLQGVVSPSITNVPVSTSINLMSPTIVADGTGSAIIIWQDRRTGSGQIYAQKMDSNMDPQWASDGVLVSLASDECTAPCAYVMLDIKAVPDGSGGAIISWTDFRNTNDPSDGDIYAQKINSSGVPQWTNNGVAVCSTAGPQYDFHMAPDGAGGAFLTWWDDRKGGDSDIHAQLISSSGEAQWTTDGLAIAVNLGDQRSPRIISDNSGGAIITWQDGAIYAQRLNSSGTTLWATSGSAEGVTVDTTGDYYYEIAADGSGGAIVTYTKGTVIDSDVYAQRVDSSGSVLWSAGGVALTSTSGYKRFPKMASDSSSGTVVIWNDWRKYPAWSGTSTHVYAQKVSHSGTVLWGTDGIAVCNTIPTRQDSHQLVADGSGGAFIAWDDYREGDWPTVDIYAQLISSNGQAQWTTDGIAITDALYAQHAAQLVLDDSTGAIITWYDGRHWDQGKSSIYAQHVSVAGTLD